MRFLLKKLVLIALLFGASLSSKEIDLVSQYQAQILLLSSEEHAKLSSATAVEQVLNQNAEKICRSMGHQLKSFALKDFDDGDLNSMCLNEKYWAHIWEINNETPCFSYKELPFVKHQTPSPLNYAEICGYGLSLVCFIGGNLTGIFLYSGLIDGITNHDVAIKICAATAGISCFNALCGLAGTIYRKTHQEYNTNDLENNESLDQFICSYALPKIATSLVCDSP